MKPSNVSNIKNDWIELGWNIDISGSDKIEMRKRQSKKYKNKKKLQNLIDIDYYEVRNSNWLNGVAQEQHSCFR